MDYLVRGKFVLTQQERYGPDGILPDGAIYVSGQDIVEVGPYKDLKAVYPTAPIVGSRRFCVMPGFVNAHQHGKGLTNFQLGGLDECLELSRVTPSPQAKAEPYADTLYGCLRMIESGVTNCIHYNSSRGPSYYEADVRERIRAYRDAGLRVSFGLDIRDRNHIVYGDEEFLSDRPASLKERVREKLTQSRTAKPEDYFRLVNNLSAADDQGDSRMKLFLTPAGPQWCTEDLLRAVKRESEERDLGVQIHVLETRYQRSYFLRTYGKSAVCWLDELGFLSPRVSLAHGVWLSRDDISLVAERGSAVVHNPSSNLRLKSGIAPLPLLYGSGVRLALGLDSSTLNDDSDMLQEMRLCASLQRIPGVNSELVPLREIFKMATVYGSEVLGWGKITGTLEPGKRADMILLDMNSLTRPYQSPWQNPINTLIYRGKASAVDTVIVDGEILYQGKKHLRLRPKSVIGQLRKSLTPPAAEKSGGLEAEILPHVIRYYQSWDEDTVVPFHKINSIQ